MRNEDNEIRHVFAVWKPSAEVEGYETRYWCAEAVRGMLEEKFYMIAFANSSPNYDDPGCVEAWCTDEEKKDIMCFITSRILYSENMVLEKAKALQAEYEETQKQIEVANIDPQILEVDYAGTESRKDPSKGVDCMSAKFTDADGYDEELYAEVDNPTDGNGDDLEDDTFSYNTLKKEIIRQAAEYGIRREQLSFYEDKPLQKETELKEMK